ncbi:MAG TPA: DUF1156 domain-containing protein [Spirochaetota bacterium]|nr:DUF1156 domain-containing protein [Spirochaetota bacterium]HPN29523.1 DUF1156 domain-containing protein [bacterium]
MIDDKRFIEESFPVREVSEESIKEKNVRKGHISTLHIWWARRPLTSSRATSYAALISAVKNIEEWNKKRQFFSILSNWENSKNKKILDQAYNDILLNNNGIPPKVLDPFGGGGTIPLESLRLGCETYSNDYNPVAVLIQKCLLEYPQKYGIKRVHKDTQEFLGSQIEEEKEVNVLAFDIEKWGKWVCDEVKCKL